MDDFETITGKVNNTGNPVAPPSGGTPLSNWKENGTNNSPSPKHPGIYHCILLNYKATENTGYFSMTTY